MWQVERKNILTGETTINPVMTKYEILDQFSSVMFDFISQYCELDGDTITVFCPTHNDELTIIKLAFSEQKGYYNQYASN